MKAKQMQSIGLLLVLVGLPAAYFAYRQDNRWSTQGQTPGPESKGALGAALPQLRAGQSSLKRIELARASDKVVLELGAEGWNLPEKSAFPAKQEAVLDLLGGLARLELIEAKTARPENYQKLGLVAPADGGQSALSVRLLDSAGAELGSLLLGEKAFDRGFTATYVKRSNEAQTYLAKGEVKGGANARDYMARDLVTWATERAEAVAAEFPAAPEQNYNAARASAEETNFALTAIPEGKEASSPYLVSGAARAIGSLRCEDVSKQGAEGAPDLSAARQAKLQWTSFDGLAVQLEAFELPAETEFGPKAVWATIRAEVLPWAGAESQNVPAPVLPVEGADSAADPAAAPAEEAKPTVSREDLEREAQEINRRTSGWLFKLEPSTATSLMRGLSELVKDPAPPPAPGSEAPPPLDMSGIDTSNLDLESMGMSQADLEDALRQLGAGGASPGATSPSPVTETPPPAGTEPAPAPGTTPAPSEPVPSTPPGSTPPASNPPATQGQPVGGPS
jgi:hypothetical protein